MGRILLTLSLVIFELGCVSGRMSNREPDRLFRERRFAESADKLREGLEDEGEGNDELLYLVDLGLVLHTDGQLKESNKYLLKADKLAEIKDYTSLAEEATTLLVGDNTKDYTGEDFEKVLINTYLAMNFAQLGEFESALVEARRVNRKLYRMITEGERKYKQNAFAHYLSAILYEASGELEDAYIDYKKTLELMPTLKYLPADLVRIARMTRRPDDLRRWRKKFGVTPADEKKALLGTRRSGYGEVVVIFQNGISPIKRPHPSFYSIPKFFPRYNPVDYADVSVGGKVVARTEVLDDIQSTAIANLDEKYAGIIAKKIAGAVVKEVVSKQVENATDSELLGAITKFAFWVSDQADIRSWNLLPKELQIARVTLPPGEHVIRLKTRGSRELPLPEKKVVIKSGKKVFISFRYVP